MPMADLAYPDYEEKQKVLDTLCGPGDCAHGAGLHSFDDPEWGLQTSDPWNSLFPLDKFPGYSGTGGINFYWVKSSPGKR